ncbi:MAG: FUSC family protein [Verrucomicrobia bacterium]|nr:FUSC family protein [Verrucomicrobiota bacterium]
MAGSNLIPAIQLSLRAGVAAGLAIIVARLFQLQHPLYAMISAVIVTDLVAEQTRKLALPRLAGTLLGSSLGALISTLLPPGVWATAFGIFAAMFASHLLYLQDAAKVAGYVCGIVLLDHTDSSWSYALFCMIETALGIGAAICVSIVPKLIKPKRPAE